MNEYIHISFLHQVYQCLLAWCESMIESIYVLTCDRELSMTSTEELCPILVQLQQKQHTVAAVLLLNQFIALKIQTRLSKCFIFSRKDLNEYTGEKIKRLLDVAKWKRVQQNIRNNVHDHHAVNQNQFQLHHNQNQLVEQDEYVQALINIICASKWEKFIK
jgi:hypothetical protein